MNMLTMCLHSIKYFHMYFSFNSTPSPRYRSYYPVLHPASATQMLCDLGQVAKPLCASSSLFVKIVLTS